MTKHQTLVTEEEMEKESHRTWWSQRTSLEKSLILVSFTVLLVMVVLASTVGVLAGKQNETIARSKRSTVQYRQTTRENVCESKACLEEAARITKYLDTSVDPCTDFYKYACGGYMDKYTIPPDKSGISQFSIIDDQLTERLSGLVQEDLGDDAPMVYKMVKDLYTSCMDTDLIDKRDVKPMKTLLKKLGGWPMVEGADWNPAGFDTFKSASRFQKLGFSDSYLMSFGVGSGLSDSSTRTMAVDEPGFGMPSRDYYLKGFDDPKVQAYYKFMVSLAEVLGADRERAMEEGKKAILLETEIAKVTTPPEDLQDYEKLNNIMTFAEMYEEFPAIPWFGYIQDLMPIDIEYTDTLLVPSPSYIRNISRIIINTPKRDIANLVMWRAAKSLVGYMPDYIRDIQLKYSKVISGVDKRQPRWKECISTVSGSLPSFIGSMYVKKYFDPEAKERAEEMVKYLKQEFNNVLENLDWMDPETKKQAFEKANTMVSYIGYPDELLDYDTLYESVEGLKITPDELLENGLRMSVYTTKKNYKKLREPVDKTHWERHAAPAVVNAYYSPTENSIQFPAGILQGVFFNKDRPNYLNFGAIGFVIGHEITHGFDNTGRQFDKKGDLFSWWSPMTNQTFLDKAKCIIEQYGEFVIEEIGEKINGKLTQGENIADNGGVKQAYKAYLQWVEDNGEEPLLPGIDLNQQQLLWLTGAHVWCGKRTPQRWQQLLVTDTHSPYAARVNVVYQNAKSFAKDFNCPLGSAMNPKHKCAVW